MTGLPFIFNTLSSPTEITKFNVILRIQKKVFWFDISVNNIILMEIVYGLARLVEEPEDFFFL